MKLFYLLPFILVVFFCKSQLVSNFEISPNPFQGKTSLSYTLAYNDFVTISVFDVFGREVAKPKDNYFLFFGYYSDEIDLSNLSDGVYFVIFSSKNYKKNLKINNLRKIETSVPINEQSNSYEFKIYPNPFKNVLHLDFNTSNFQNFNYFIYNFLGELVCKGTLSSIENRLDVSFLTKGYYSLRIISENKFETFKLIKD